MKRIPIRFKTDETSVILHVSTRVDKAGNIFYFVEYPNLDSGLTEYVAFKHLSSALDFIQTNFK